MYDADLTATVTERLNGDRSKACFAVATIGNEVKRTIVCADSNNTRALTTDTVFEIGSVSKPMTATVVAALVNEGRLSLDDPFDKLLPSGTRAPRFEGQPILLRHIVTHTAGLPPLPSKMSLSTPFNPYAGLTEQQLLESLAEVKLAQAPGSQFAYSNFGMMLLSYGLANFTGESFSTLLKRYVSAPVGMTHTYTIDAPQGAQIARGHNQNGMPMVGWNFAVDTHGAGGIRASLNDMIRFVQANLGMIDTTANSALQQTQQVLTTVGGTTIGMNWLHREVGDLKLIMHEGGTGGFSSLVAFDPTQKQGVVILSDTSMNAVNGLSGLAMHILAPSMPLPEPRALAIPDAALLEGLSGDYALDGGMRMAIRHDNGALYIQAQGQPEFKMGYDSAGDFFPEAFDALLRPQRTAGGYRFTWFQGGGAMQAQPIAQTTHTPIELTAEQLADYIGEYPLIPGFGLKVFVKDDALFIQGTGQQALRVEAIVKDQFTRDDVGAHFVFERDAKDKVTQLTLKQGGQTLTGERQ